MFLLLLPSVCLPTCILPNLSPSLSTTVFSLFSLLFLSTLELLSNPTLFLPLPPLSHSMIPSSLFFIFSPPYSFARWLLPFISLHCSICVSHRQNVWCVCIFVCVDTAVLPTVSSWTANETDRSCSTLLSFPVFALLYLSNRLPPFYNALFYLFFCCSIHSIVTLTFILI